MKLRNRVKVYMQVPGFDFTGSFLSVASDTLTIILIRLTFYHEKNGWVLELCDVEAAFLHPNMEFEMYIEWTESILDLGIITKEFLEEYFILPRKLMSWNFYAALLWLILLVEYSVNGFNLKRSKINYCISFNKDEKGKL